MAETADWLFVTDLHGDEAKWARLFELMERGAPQAVLLGGDLLPSGWLQPPTSPGHEDFLADFVAVRLRRMREAMGARYPHVLAILGNDDARSQELSVLAIAAEGLWTYAHDRRVAIGDFDVYGYSYVPPTPFLLKDWERYDVSRYVDPGCVSPEEGWRTIPVRAEVARTATIESDLERMTAGRDLSRAVMLFHAPPYGGVLDRAALDRVRVDHAPVDVHVGSIAIRRFIERRRPRVTLHGHVHEAYRLTCSWREKIGETWCLGAAHDGTELCVVRFDARDPEQATRNLL